MLIFSDDFVGQFLDNFLDLKALFKALLTEQASFAKSKST